MNAKVNLWTDALRSGSYRQTTGRLIQRSRVPWRRHSFCAMGVLYDLYVKSCGERWSKSTQGRLPAAALAWAGISRRLEETVIMHNDRGTSFRDIASIIEAHFARLERSEEVTRIVDQAIERARAAARRSQSAERDTVSLIDGA